jgi:glycosyltransferase involved in cell wall biosynthesis
MVGTMKLLYANKYYFLKGGAERYMLDLAALMMHHGHEVVPFAMRDRRNLPSQWKRYFVSPVETERVSFSPAGLKTAGRILYSHEARRKFAALLDASTPDLVHIHNIYHQISPSILPEAKERKIPVVMTAHDYKLVAPNYSLFHDGAICERTKPDRYWECFKHRCVKGSYAASFLESLEMSLHRKWRIWRDNIDLVIAPSRFVAALLADYGFPEKKIIHVPHFVDGVAWTPWYIGSYALYVGRLSPEKGVDVLIRAAAKAKHVPVRIIGDGPDEARLRKLAATLGATNVDFHGYKRGEALEREYAGARFLVIPSVWYEVAGLITLEAYAAGKPVIASQIGGLAELVREGETGLFASAGDADGLASQMAALWEDQPRCEEMGRAARHWIETDFTPDKHYKAIMEVYKGILAGRQGS